nr:EOG090X0D82 [Eulimnadia texana]
MYGLIVSGRLVQTDFTQVGPTQVVTTVADADNINHIVVFLTGTQPFPDGFGGAVYFSWPDPAAPPAWQYLGFISNQKPSAIFRITKLKTSVNELAIVPTFGLSQISHNAQIGISVEPMDQIAALVPSTSSDTASTSTFMEFAQKTVENLFNFAASFATTQSHMLPNPSEMYVPLSVLRRWFDNFQRRLEQNPTFWRS